MTTAEKMLAELRDEDMHPYTRATKLREVQRVYGEGFARHLAATLRAEGKRVDEWHA